MDPQTCSLSELTKLISIQNAKLSGLATAIVNALTSQNDADYSRFSEMSATESAIRDDLTLILKNRTVDVSSGASSGASPTVISSVRIAPTDFTGSGQQTALDLAVALRQAPLPDAASIAAEQFIDAALSGNVDEIADKTIALIALVAPGVPFTSPLD